MKLESIELCLGKIGKIDNQITSIEAERVQLTAKISDLTATVAAGNAESVNDLAIAKARQEVLPAELAGVRQTRTACIKELAGELAGLYPKLGRAYSDEHQRVRKVVTEFLGQFLSDGHIMQEMARQVADDCKSVRKLDAIRGQFSGLMMPGIQDPHSVLSRAQYAIKQLKDF